MTKQRAARDGLFDGYRAGDRTRAHVPRLRGHCHRAPARDDRDLKVAREVASSTSTPTSPSPRCARRGRPRRRPREQRRLRVDGSVEEVPLADVRRMFETNFFGAARMIQAFVPAMREQGAGHHRQRLVRRGHRGGAAGGLLLRVEVRARGAVRGAAPRGRALRRPTCSSSSRAPSRPVRREPRRPPRGPGPYGRSRGAVGRPRACSAGASRPQVPSSSRSRSATRSTRGPPLRVPVGADAELVAATRNPSSYESLRGHDAPGAQIDW